MRRSFPAFAAAAAVAVSVAFAADSFEPNDTLETAHGPLLAGQAIESYISTATDLDWFFIDADSGDVVVTLTDLPAGIDYDLFLLDAAGNILERSDTTGSLDERVERGVFQPVRLWIQVFAPFGDLGEFSADDPYVLTPTFTAVNQPPAITLLSPDGGETWTAETVNAITWSASDPESGNSVSLDLEFSDDDGATWEPIATGLDNTGTHDWSVPSVETAAARIRALATDPDGATAADTSAAPFTIVIVPNEFPTAALISPDGGEALISGASETIRWTASDPEDGSDLDVALELSVDDAATWTSIVASTDNDGSFDWTVPAVVTDSARVRVLASDSDAATAADTSDAVFSIHSFPAGAAVLDLADDVAVDGGRTVGVPVTLDHDQPLGRLELTVTFDPDRLEPRSVRVEDRASALTAAFDPGTPGEVSIVLDGGAIPTGTGPILELIVLALPGFDGTVPLTLGRAAAVDSEARPMSLTATGGSIVVTDVPGTLTLSVPPAATADPGDTLQVPVTFAADLEVSALQFALAFDPDVLDPIDVVQGARTAGMTLETNLDGPGTVRALFFYPGAGRLLPGEGTACTFRFAVADSAPGNTALTFADVAAANPEGVPLDVTALDGSVTPVSLVRFSGAAVPAGVRLAWTGGTPSEVAGYRVLRDSPDGYAALHPGLLGPEAVALTDPAPRPGAVNRYRLDRIERSGATRGFGPVAIRVPPGIRAGMPFPNPASGPVRWELGGLSPEAAVHVVDVRGRLVRGLPGPAENGHVRWDGLTGDGRPAPPGIYFLIARDPAGRAVRRIVRVAD